MITIIPNSPLQYGTNPTYYSINDVNFDSKLFFTSTVNTLYYTIIRDTNVVFSGKLSGHYNNVDYDYRFDFNNYISIDDQTLLTINKSLLRNLIGDGLNTGYTINQIDYNHSCNLYLVLSTNEIINTNITAGNLTKLSDGNVLISNGKTIDNIVCDQYLNLIFRNKKVDSNAFMSDNSILFTGSKCVLTLYKNPIDNKIKFVNSNGDYLYITKSDTINYTSYLIDISNIVKIYFTILNDEGIEENYEYKISQVNKNLCYNDYYYFNNYGVLDIVRCAGTKNEIDTITKKNIKLGNKVIQTSIKNVKQIKQNTGFNLTEDIINSLIMCHNIYSIDNEIVKGYILDNNSFTGYNGIKLSGKNIELTLTDPKQYQRKTNYKLNFFEQ